jgi:RNA polymerase sigma-70 factor (ECF subfamily)
VNLEARMVEPAEDPLTTGLAQGREEAFAALYDRFGRPLFQTALLLLGSHAEAEDAVQDVFVGLVRAGPALAGVQNLRAYLFAALRHATAQRSAGRKRQRAVSLDDVPEPTAAGPNPVERERSVRLEKALLALPAEQRELVALKVDGGLTFAEVAAVLSISPNTAASRYRYALDKLRSALKEQPHG